MHEWQLQLCQMFRLSAVKAVLDRQVGMLMFVMQIIVLFVFDVGGKRVIQLAVL